MRRVNDDDIWTAFDAILHGDLSSPWSADGPGVYEPDFDALLRLLEVPVRLGAPITSGWHAKAVDAWIAQELRRSGFGEDEVWPRRGRPRVLPQDVATLLDRLPKVLAEDVRRRLSRDSLGVAPADARILGKAYYKQVDVVMSHWARGPELMVSTKRLGSSLANNALNRVEESYGDAHNLRGRHPLAAIGYVLVLRERAIVAAQSSAERLLDLVAKMGLDRAGYDATAVVVVEWEDGPQPPPGRAPVWLVSDRVPEELGLGRFMRRLVTAVLDRTPVETHREARRLRASGGLFVGHSQPNQGV